MIRAWLADVSGIREVAPRKAVEAATPRDDARVWIDFDGEDEKLERDLLRPFGIHPLVLPERADTLDQAVAALLELPAVEGVHVVAADGRVLASSDRKLETTGVLDERDRWVLATTELTTREGDRPGVVQLAAPIVGPAGPAGYLWLAYDAEAAREAARPAA